MEGGSDRRGEESRERGREREGRGVGGRELVRGR